MTRTPMVFAICVLVGAGCGKKSSGSTPAGGGAGGGMPPPMPLSVKPHADPSQTKSGTIGPSGGSITLQGTDGSSYTLTLPKDALLGDETIALTALQSVDGLPLSGGFLAGVDIAPEGLRLLKAATLAITPAAAPPSGESAVGFGSRGDGSEFHLDAVSAGGGADTLSLIHFSAHGVGAGTSADVSAQQQQHPPTEPDDWLAQQRASNPDAAALHDDLASEGQQLQAEAGAATGEETLVTDASMFADWEAAGGASDPALAPVDQAIGAALVNAAGVVATTEMANCLATPDLKYAVRLLQLSGWVQTNLSRWASGTPFADQVSRCARFELDIDSTTTARNGSPGSVTAQVHGSVKDIVSAAPPPAAQFTGSGPLAYGTLSFDVPAPCSGSISGSDGTAQVTSIALPIDLGSASLLAPADVASQVAVSLDLHSNPPRETLQYQCMGQSETIPATLWLAVVTYFHQGVRQADGTFAFSGWVPGGDPGVVGTLTFDNQADAVGTEHTVLTLRLTPG